MNKEIEMLYKNLEAKDKIINKQVLEIARLKEKIEKAIAMVTNIDYTHTQRLGNIKDILGDKEWQKN